MKKVTLTTLLSAVMLLALSGLAMASTRDQPSALGYRVRRGDSLYLIAGKFNISVKDIVNWNSLDPSRYLQPGQKLTLYVSSL